MKTRAVWLAALLLIGCLSVGPGFAQVVNIMENGDFETGELAPWGFYGPNTNEIVQTVEGAAVPEGVVQGDYCLHVTVDAPGANFWDTGLKSDNNNTLTFEQGKVYTLSAFCKSAEGELQINFKPELDASPYTGYGASLTMTEEWQELHVTTAQFSSTVDPAAITFHIAYTAGEFWMDYIQFYEGEYVETVFGARVTARSPQPDIGATDISFTPVLSWTAGDFAETHDVYLGTNFDDVNEANRTDDRGVLVSQGQADTSYAPDMRLALNTTYYWRIDEVNAPSSPAVYPGEVWSFTTEPVSYTLTNVTATASSEHTAQTGADNLVNGSGLDPNDGHSTQSTDMWLSGMAETLPQTVEFAFDQPYALHEMLVWNSNQGIEALLGFGAKDVVIETSVDGENWTVLEGMDMFNQATGIPGDQANTTVAFNGTLAQYVRVTINSNYNASGFIQQVSLSEVRFSYIPVVAREPMPANGAVVTDLDVTLGWRPGREAAEHEVVFSTDKSAVIDGSAVVDTVSTTTYGLATLDLGTAYAWRINEVNDAGTNPRYEGNVWEFKTPEMLTFEDFEMYKDEEFLEIWSFWVDGYEDDNNGSFVGAGDSGNEPETGTVQEGRQSLPMEYDNTTAPLSEATRTFNPPLDLTKGNPDNVGVYFHGAPAGFVENADGSITLSGIGGDIHNGTDEFNFAYKTLNGDGSMTARIDSIQDTHEWAKAGIMIRRSLTPDDVYVHTIATPRGNSEIKFREITGLTTTGGAGNSVGDTPLPLWLRLTREGEIIKAERSADGVAWEPVLTDDAEGSQVNLFMTGPIFIGLVVTSHADVPCTAMFSNISSSGGVSGDWQTEAMSVPQPDNDAAPVYMTLTDSANNTATIEHPDPAATQISAWTLLSAPVSDLSVNLSAIKSITIGVGGSNVTGTLFADNIHTSSLYDNWLFNGGFEDGVQAPWNVYGVETATVVGELVDAAVPEGPAEGNYCLFVDVNTVHANPWDAGLQPAGAIFKAGNQYTVSAWLKSKAGPMDIGMKPELAADPWTGFGAQTFTITEEWAEYSVTTPVFATDTAPAGFSFHVGTALGGFWVDGVRFYAGPYKPAD